MAKISMGISVWLSNHSGFGGIFGCTIVEVEIIHVKHNVSFFHNLWNWFWGAFNMLPKHDIRCFDDSIMGILKAF